MALPPELYVEADADAIRGVVPDLCPDMHRPGWLVGRGWRVRPVPDGLEQALAARGVTVDALGVGPAGELICADAWGAADALGAQAALGLVAGAATLQRDPSMLLRLGALTAELGWPVEPKALVAMTENAALVMRVNRHEQRTLLTELLMGRRADEGLEVLVRSGVLTFVLPEVTALIDFHRTSRYHHKDLWAHTKQVVRQALPRVRLRWAALLHDVGKAHTRTFGPGRAVHFFHHEALGALMFEGVAARLRMPAAMADRVRTLIFHHLRANLYLPSWTDSAVRRFAAEMGPLVDDLIALSRADCTSRRPTRRREVMWNLHELRGRLSSVKAADAARRSCVPKGLGLAIIKGLGVSPGPRVGELRRACEQAVRDGILPSKPEIAACIEFLGHQEIGEATDAVGMPTASAE